MNNQVCVATRPKNAGKKGLVATVRSPPTAPALARLSVHQSLGGANEGDGRGPENFAAQEATRILPTLALAQYGRGILAMMRWSV